MTIYPKETSLWKIPINPDLYTVSANRARILKKMDVKNNAELMRYAIERGLVS